MTLQSAAQTPPAGAHALVHAVARSFCDDAERQTCVHGRGGGVLRAWRKSAEIYERGACSWQTTALAVAKMTAGDVAAVGLAVMAPTGAAGAPRQAWRVVRDCVGGGCLLGGMAVEIAADVSYPLYRHLDLTLERLVGTP